MKKILIIGGAGFIGSNAARYFSERKWEVTIFDDFSRKGTDFNVKWLQEDFPKITVIRGDIVKDLDSLKTAIGNVDIVLHLAAQVAVTTSIVDPQHDFNVNGIGTFNILEAIRTSQNKPILLYSSTNKVYGCLEHYKVKSRKERFVFSDKTLASYGISEKENLDFHSPYGCSKGLADQYVIDYSRIYGLKTVVFRQSCVYGPYQFGVEDQGWVAWFAIAALLNKKITLYGTGKQVRDILYIDDLLSLYEKAILNINKASGNAYNVGGGPKNTLSLIELLKTIDSRLGKKTELSRAETRAGDQPVFIADIRKAKKHLGWKPAMNVEKGFEKMMSWIEEHQEIFKTF